MTVVWVLVGAGLLLGLLVLVTGRRALRPVDDEHPWSIDVRRGEVRIPRQQ